MPDSQSQKEFVQLIELDSKVTVIRNQLDLLLTWIVDKFGQEDSFPIDLINSLVPEQSRAQQSKSVKVKQEHDGQQQQQLIVFEETEDVDTAVDVDPLSINSADKNDDNFISFYDNNRDPVAVKPATVTVLNNNINNNGIVTFKPCSVKLMQVNLTTNGRNTTKDDTPKSSSPTSTSLKNTNRKLNHNEKIRPKSYPCDQCSKSFPAQSNLRIHYRTHTGEKPFVCSFYGCGKRFQRLDHVQRHEQLVSLHTVEKSYVCDFYGCGKRYRQSNHLKRHQITHQNELKLPGTSCNAKQEHFSSGSSILNNNEHAEIPEPNIIIPKIEESQSQEIDSDSEFNLL